MMKFSWLDKTEYPFQSNYFEVNGQNLHYIDEGEGDVLLFVHGTPSWSFDFRNMIKELSKTFRCIAIDHIGFGLSDKPEGYDYSTQNHAKTLASFIDEKQLNRFTMIVHDFGGPIGLSVAIDQPERIKNLIVLNSWLWSSENDPEFIKLKKILKSPLLPFLYRQMNFSPRFILPKSFGKNKITRKLLKQYTKPFANSSERNGALAFAKSLLNDQEWFEYLWNRVDVIEEKRTLFVWGMSDKVINPKYLEKFQTKFSNSQTLRLETCGHFPQEEEWEKLVESFRNFLK